MLNFTTCHLIPIILAINLLAYSGNSAEISTNNINNNINILNLPIEIRKIIAFFYLASLNQDLKMVFRINQQVSTSDKNYYFPVQNQDRSKIFLFHIENNLPTAILTNKKARQSLEPVDDTALIIAGSLSQNEEKSFLCSQKGQVLGWDMHNGKLLVNMFLGDTNINTAIFNKDQQVILTLSAQQPHRVYLWNLTDNNYTYYTHTEHVISTSFSPSGNFIYTLGLFKACIWQIYSGEKLIELSFNNLGPRDFYHNGNNILIVSETNKIIDWNIQQRSFVECLRKNKFPLNIINFGPLKKSAFATGYPSLKHASNNHERACCWDLRTGEQLMRGELYGHGYHIDKAVFISPDGSLFTSGTDDSDREYSTFWDLSCESGEMTYETKGIIACIFTLKDDDKQERSILADYFTKIKACINNYFRTPNN